MAAAPGVLPEEHAISGDLGALGALFSFYGVVDDFTAAGFRELRLS